MDIDIQDIIIPLVAFIIPAIGLLVREIHYRRKAKRQAADDSSKVLKERKTLLEEMVSKAEDPDIKNNFLAQIDEVNAALMGLHTERLRSTLKDAGLPPEEVLVADGLSQLQPEQVIVLKEDIKEVEDLPQSESMRDSLALANAYYYSGKYGEARKIYDRILNRNPHNPKVLYNRGITYIKLKQYNEALTDLNNSLALSPNDPVTLYSRGNTYLELRKYDKAIVDYTQSLKFRPADWKTLTNRGITYIKLGKYDEAITDLNRALKLEPNDPCTLYNLACFFSLQRNADDALHYLKKAIDKDKKWREEAKTDKDLDNIRDDPRFKKLVGEDCPPKGAEKWI